MKRFASKCATAIVIAIATILAMPPSPGDVHRQPAGFSEPRYDHLGGHRVTLAGVLCYDNYYNPPRAQVCF
jgi:hypothetical protein